LYSPHHRNLCQIVQKHPKKNYFLPIKFLQKLQFVYKFRNWSRNLSTKNDAAPALTPHNWLERCKAIESGFNLKFKAFSKLQYTSELDLGKINIFLKKRGKSPRGGLISPIKFQPGLS
jgi:hypothetical protein